MAKPPKAPNRLTKTFYAQTLPIRYKGSRQLQVELDKALGPGHWKDAQGGACMDEWVVKVTRMLTDAEIETINNNLRVHHGG